MQNCVSVVGSLCHQCTGVLLCRQLSIGGHTDAKLCSGLHEPLVQEESGEVLAPISLRARPCLVRNQLAVFMGDMLVAEESSGAGL